MRGLDSAWAWVIVGALGAAAACGGEANSTDDSPGGGVGGLGASGGAGAEPAVGGSQAPGGSPSVGGGAPNPKGGSAGVGTIGGAATVQGGSAAATGGAPSGGSGLGGKGGAAGGGAAQSGGGTDAGGAGKGGTGGAGKGGSGGSSTGASGGADLGGAGGSGGEDPGCTVAAGCRCPAHTGTDYYADPTNGSDLETEGLRPTGVENPPQCRFATLTKALSKVQSGERVIAISDKWPSVFANETFPLTVPLGVTLTSESERPMGNYRIRYTALNGTAVVLQNGAAFDHFYIANAGGSGRLVACSSGSDAIKLESLWLEGDASISAAAKLGCAAAVNKLQVTGSQSCVDVSPSLPGTAGVTLANAALTSCNVGITVSGELELTQSRVEDNRDGIVIDGGLATIQSSGIDHNRLTGGGGSGITLKLGELHFSSSTLKYNAGPGLRMSNGSAWVEDSSMLDSNGLTDDMTKSGSTFGSGIYATGGSFLGVWETELVENGSHGVHIDSGRFNGSVTLQLSTMTSNLGAGLQIDGTVEGSVQLDGLYVTKNQNGGLVFNQPVSLLVPSGNQLLANRVDQLRFHAAAPEGTWHFSAAGTCARANQIGCFPPSAFGIVATPSVPVDASHTSWSNATLISGRDYAGPVTVSDPCPVFTCE